MTIPHDIIGFTAYDAEQGLSAITIRDDARWLYLLESGTIGNLTH